jgi:hypothetical protein
MILDTAVTILNVFNSSMVSFADQENALERMLSSDLPQPQPYFDAMDVLEL